jgi:hypothetical protein
MLRRVRMKTVVDMRAVIMVGVRDAMVMRQSGKNREVGELRLTSSSSDHSWLGVKSKG